MSQVEGYDVIVVGAGPAGSTAAYHLADAGSLQVSREELDHALLRAALARPGISFRVFIVKTVERLSGGWGQVG